MAFLNACHSQSAHNSLVRKPEAKESLERIRQRWEDNRTNDYIKGYKIVDWIPLVNYYNLASIKCGLLGEVTGV